MLHGRDKFKFCVHLKATDDFEDVSVCTAQQAQIIYLLTTSTSMAENGNPTVDVPFAKRLKKLHDGFQARLSAIPRLKHCPPCCSPRGKIQIKLVLGIIRNCIFEFRVDHKIFKSSPPQSSGDHAVCQYVHRTADPVSTLRAENRHVSVPL